jgi:hypothetical protein
MIAFRSGSKLWKKKDISFHLSKAIKFSKSLPGHDSNVIPLSLKQRKLKSTAQRLC